jgi:hypothetical protein
MLFWSRFLQTAGRVVSKKVEEAILPHLIPTLISTSLEG